MTGQEGRDLRDSLIARAQSRVELREGSGEQESAESTRRRCRKCKRTGHNARTCKEDAEMSTI
ncbi:hypothetical protein BZA70DRAFT_275916 [Myxozyma melibiosi]|uniref:CCHC-type domain-containing protein n=1 Tax=Myxozyma melibiosi TaxID=54550 RepID=A0ABR1F8K0_9ASCO